MLFGILKRALMLLNVSFLVKNHPELADKVVLITLTAYHGGFFLFACHHVVSFDFINWPGHENLQELGYSAIILPKMIITTMVTYDDR